MPSYLVDACSRGMASIGELWQRPGQARPEAALLKSREGNAGVPKQQKARVHKTKERT